jgi:NAD(P)-dependent dehydrogenase (short-subunit alcohol dehydrogenase family)
VNSFVINCIAPWQMTVAFQAQLEKSLAPRAITLTRQMGSLERAKSDRVAYRSSKAAANMAMRTLAIALQEKGIPVCMLHPGWVRTDMGGEQAALDVEQSTKGMLDVIDQLTLEHSGRFLDYQGVDIPW